jgi:dTDP-glucose pyrophosphorylase
MYKKHLVDINTPTKEVLNKLNSLGFDNIVFLTNKKRELVGSVTDGDIRRGLLDGLKINDSIEEFIEENPKYIKKSKYSINSVISLRENGYGLVPVLNDKNQIIDIINFRIQINYLPVDAVLMAGGLGSRLKPLTDKTPKPLLKISGKTVIEYNVDRLAKFGINNYYFCLNHMSEKIEKHLNMVYAKNQEKTLSLNYILEEFPMGTIGGVSKITDFNNKYVLITNSDIINTINYEQFFLDFKKKNADISIITIPYLVDIPYGVTTVETSENDIISLEEKPKYTHYCNGGIYLVKKSILKQIPNNKFYNATDLLTKLINNKSKVISYPINDYWMDIGSKEDYKKAKKDIKNLDLL